ncbi:GDSL esterase/lipase At4g16220-like [Rosa rugosa]|uniref:GDSL esterase/lipase At4g16220-like n=1 Tax=Rosa rugosa TaxID=74645 RepID=UPI002B40DD2D|nr:GDSL esterase/lipase At4g16220-like [Rosa rugosa]
MGSIFFDGKFVLGIIFALWRICLAKETTANFVFGDSLVEVGDNNYIPSLSKADYPPNGIDFGKPTGRYTNGRTVIDIIAQSALGLKEFTPPYLAPTTAGPITIKLTIFKEKMWIVEGQNLRDGRQRGRNKLLQ